MTEQVRLRVVVAKIGLDGHDRGARVIARLLRDFGHEVIYLGRRQTAERIARVATDEDADVVGLSVLSGTHQPNAKELIDALSVAGARARVVVGGTILRREIPALLELGVDAVFPVQTPLEEIRSYFAGVAEASSAAGP